VCVGADAADGLVYSAVHVKSEASLRPDIPVVPMDYNVNDPEFSREATDMLLRMIEKERHHGDRA
jgi:hypothetical protein